MASAIQRIEVRELGGLNYADDPASLLQRSHVPASWGWSPRAPMEFRELKNMDFRPGGIIKRLGSTLLGTITFSASDTTLVGAVEFVTNGGTRTHVAVTDTAMYYSTDGGSTWARITASGGGAYTHSGVTKCSFAFGDGRLFIGLDGTNKIQVFRTGTSLDPAMDNGNTYTHIYSGTSAITGIWGTGYYMVEWFQSRLLFSTGNSVIEYTPSGSPWDRAAGGFDEARAGLIAMKTFTRRFGNELTEVIFYNTHQGMQVKTGFDVSDTVHNITGTHATLNHRTIIASQDWLIYPTLEQTIEAVNPQGVIDLGRRLRSLDGSTGILDSISLSSTQTSGFGFWNEKAKQAQFFIVDGVNSTVSHAIVTDFQKGEPVTGEPKDSYELRTRHLVWYKKTPPWFSGVYQAQGAVIGFMSTGTFYTIADGQDDLGSDPVEDILRTPDFTPAIGVNTQWRAFRPRFAESGNWNVVGNYFINLDNSPIGSDVNFIQLNNGTAIYGTAIYDSDSYATGGAVHGYAMVDLYAESLSIQLKQQEATRDYQLFSFSMEFTLGASV